MQQQGFRPSTLVPQGFAVESAVFGDTGALITIRYASKGNACPRCGRISERVHADTIATFSTSPWPAGG